MEEDDDDVEEGDSEMDESGEDEEVFDGLLEDEFDERNEMMINRCGDDEDDEYDEEFEV